VGSQGTRLLKERQPGGHRDAQGAGWLAGRLAGWLAGSQASASS